MRPWRAAAAAAVILFLSAFAVPPPAEAGWNATRTQAATLRENGRAAEAYATVTAWQGTAAASRFDAEFMAGWISLRDLRRADQALAHFLAMARHAPSLAPARRDAGRAKAGYWLGRTLRELGRKADSDAMFRAAMAYPTAFYGQLAASEIGVRIGREHLRGHESKYPVREIYWHDGRVRKEMVLAVIREESSFRQSVSSNRGARGMMQVLDGTARQVGREAGVSVDISLMRTNADYNIAVGSRYLADKLARYGGNPMLAAAAYNAGPQRADEWLRRFGDPRGGRMDPVDWAESIPFHETREYVQKVISTYVVYRALLSD